MRSVGVTAKVEATIPVATPASKFRIGVSVPVSGSAKEALIMSKERKRTASLAMEP